MTTKDRLHRLVDVLPAADAATAERVLYALAAAGDPVALACALAPDDDEAETAEERATVAESHADLDAGRVFTMDELRAQWAAEGAQASMSA